VVLELRTREGVLVVERELDAERERVLVTEKQASCPAEELTDGEVWDQYPAFVCLMEEELIQENNSAAYFLRKQTPSQALRPVGMDFLL